MFKYDQPVSPAKTATAAASAQGQTAGFQLADLVQALWRRKIAIVGAGLICACAAVMVGKSLTPRYTATAQLYVDPRELQLVDRELTPRSQDSSSLSMVVESQARLITSNNVLLRVIEDNRLEQDPEFGGPSIGLLSSLFSLPSFGSKPSQDDKMAARTVALESLNRRLTVKRTDRTYVIDIDVWSTDPAKAAKLANAISNAYLQESRESQSVAARRATSDLSGRLRELQGRLRTAENALEVYKAKNNFVGTQDTLVSDQQLLAGTQRVAAAKALTLDAQARYDQIEASRKAATDAGAMPEALQSPTIANLRAQYAEARKRYAELTNELGPRHPLLRNTEKQVEDIKRNIGEEVARYAQSAKNDLARARDYEASLNKALDAQKRQSVDLSQASVRLRELERDVEAGRNVYQSFLKRSRETEEQETLNTSSARVIGEATQPQRRTFPPAMSMIAMIGFMAGALAAAGLVIAADRLSTPATPKPLPQPEVTPAPPALNAEAEIKPQPRAVVAKTNLDLHSMVTSPPIQAVAPAPVVASVPPEKARIARLVESDVFRTLTGILVPSDAPDVTKLGWPTLRAAPNHEFPQAVRQMRANAARHVSSKGALIFAVVGRCVANERSIVALNVALVAARDGARVLLVDADHARHVLSDKMLRYKATDDGRRWLNFGAKAPVTIATENGIAILPSIGASRFDKALAEAQASGHYDLILLDGPALPITGRDGKVLSGADGVIAALTTANDINVGMDEIIAALGGSERKIVGVVIDELHAPETAHQKAKQYA